MDVDLKLYEEFSLKSISHTIFNCGYSEDGRIYILAQSGVYIFTLTGSVDNAFTELSFKKQFLVTSEFTPSMNLGCDLESFIYSLPRNEFYEAVLRLDVSSPKILETTTTVTPNAISALWSPRGIVGKTDSLLAVHTNLCSLEIYAKCIRTSGKSDYICIVNISKDTTEYFKSSWEPVNLSKASKKYQEFKRRVSIVTISAYTWSHIFSVKNEDFILIIVGHLDGGIAAWKIPARKLNNFCESSATFLGRCKTDLEQITCLYWHKSSDTTAALIVGDLRGMVSVINVKNWDKDVVDFGDNILLWDHLDFIRVQQIHLHEYEKFTYILSVKGRSLLILAIDEEGVVYDKKLYTPGSGAYQITGLQHLKGNTWSILNMNGLFTQFELLSRRNEIDICSTNIPLKIPAKKFGILGFVMSPNQVLFAFVASPIKYRFAVRGKKFQHVFFFRNMSLDPFKLLMENKSGSLRDYWDCIDMLRVSSLKEKRFPWLGIDKNINYDELSLLQLKTLRIISKLSENVVSVVPIIREYHIKPYVLLHYMVDIKLAIQRMQHLLQLRMEGIELTKFQMRSIDLLNFFLKEMVMRNILAKAQLGETFIDEIMEVMAVANELKYPPMPQCFWCGEKIIGPSCIPPHVDSRCAISLMPIMFIPAYQCPYCKATVHNEIENEIQVIMCPYCDMPMEFAYHDRSIQSDIGNSENDNFTGLAFSTSPPEEIVSTCHEDCAKDEIRLEDLSDNTTEYAIISDSEDEEEANEILNLYWKTHSSELKIERAKCSGSVT